MQILIILKNDEASVGVEIAWRVELVVKRIKQRNFLALTDEMVKTAGADRWMFELPALYSPDGYSCSLYER
jgi:hypothetical protein